MPKSDPPPFSFLELPAGRSQQKPRRAGLTMMVDFGLGTRMAEDLLEATGSYIDLAKIAVGTSRLYPSIVLKEKLEIYKSRGVRPFVGGQFQEYVFATYGFEALPRFLAEAKRVGFDVVEISDNCVPLNDSQRHAQIRMAIDSGLAVFGEVGSKETLSDPVLLVRQAEVCFQAGAELVLVEAAELIQNGRPNQGLIDCIRNGLDMSKVLIELPGPWISGATMCAIDDMSKWLVAEFGPDVNVANVLPQNIMSIEALRVGLGVVGPKGTHT